MLTTAAALRGATKHYKTFALGPVDLAVPAGSILGLIGENGAGKTTALKLLCGAIRSDGGSVELLGGSPADPAIRARIGVVFEDAYFPDCFNAACVGKSMAGIFGKRWDTAKFDALVRRFELDGSKKIKEYSRGMRMKLSLATALAHDPELLILDDFSMGLDPGYRRLFVEYLRDFAAGGDKTIFLTSHIIQDMELLIDDCMILDYGRLLIHKPTREIMDNFHRFRFSLDEGQQPATHEKLWNTEKTNGQWITYSFEPLATVRQLLEAKGAHVSDLKEETLTLEDAFIGLTGKY